MRVGSLPSAFARALLLIVACGAGLYAALGSQSGARDYHALFRMVAGLTVLSVVCTAGFMASTRGWVRWLPVPAAWLAVAGTCEFALRLWGW